MYIFDWSPGNVCKLHLKKNECGGDEVRVNICVNILYKLQTTLQ